MSATSERRGAQERDARFAGSERWRAILDAASELFSTKGYEETSMQEIADAVGMLKGSLYHYIRNKEDLLFHLLLEIHDDLSVHFEEYARAEGTALTKVAAFVDGHSRHNIREIARGPIFYRNFQHLGTQRQAVILERRRNFDRFLRELIRQGQDEGVIRLDVDVEIAVLIILTAMNSLHVWYHAEHGNSEERVAHEFTRMFLLGLAVPGESPERLALTGDLGSDANGA